MRIAQFAHRLALALRDPHELVDALRGAAGSAWARFLEAALPAAEQWVDKTLVPLATRLHGRIAPRIRRAFRHALGPGCERLPDSLESAQARQAGWEACSWRESDTARTWAERFCAQVQAGLSQAPQLRPTRPTTPWRAIGLAFVAFFAHDPSHSSWPRESAELPTWRRPPRRSRRVLFGTWKSLCAGPALRFFQAAINPLGHLDDRLHPHLWIVQLALALALAAPAFILAFIACYFRVLFGSRIERRDILAKHAQALRYADEAMWCLAQAEPPEPATFDAWTDEMGTNPVFENAPLRSWPELCLAAFATELPGSAIRLALHAAKSLPDRERSLAAAAFLHALASAYSFTIELHFDTRNGPMAVDAFLDLAAGAIPHGLPTTSRLVREALMAPGLAPGRRLFVFEHIYDSSLDALVRSASPNGGRLGSPEPWIELILAAPWPSARMAIRTLAETAGVLPPYHTRRSWPAAISLSERGLLACACAYGSRPELRANGAPHEQLLKDIGTAMAEAASASREKALIESDLPSTEFGESPPRKTTARRL